VSSLKKSSAESKRNVRKNSSPRRRSVARGSNEVRVVVVEAGASEEAEEEVAGEDEEVDLSTLRTCITIRRPWYSPERPGRARGEARCQRPRSTATSRNNLCELVYQTRSLRDQSLKSEYSTLLRAIACQTGIACTLWSLNPEGPALRS
jgi:hypothetical protein